MDLTTLVIAILGLVLSIAGLVWQAATYVLSGGRVKIEFLAGAMHADGSGMVTGRASVLSDANIRRVAEQGYVYPVMGVRVRNVGRMPVTVAGWSIAAKPGLSFHPTGGSIGKPLPHRLEAGESEMWMVDAVEIQAMVHATREVAKVPPGGVVLTGEVELADGRTVISPDRLRA